MIVKSYKTHKIKIIFIAAISLDGKITMGDNSDVHAFTSPEDALHFRSLLDKSELVVMGRRTYDTIKNDVKHIPGRIRIILTREPEKYKRDEIKDQLEFTDESPKNLSERLAEKGYKEMLLVSGSTISTEFFKANLVDEIYLTLEPWILGAGKPVVLDNELNKKFELLKIKKLNSKGTLLLHYKLLNSS